MIKCVGVQSKQYWYIILKATKKILFDKKEISKKPSWKKSVSIRTVINAADSVQPENVRNKRTSVDYNGEAKERSYR